VEDATSAVSETVATVKDSIQDTVSTVTGSVQDTVTTVKDTFQEGVETVKSLFDVPEIVAHHPWPAMAGAVALGFCLERYFGKTDSVAQKMAEAAPPAPAPSAVVSGKHGHR